MHFVIVIETIHGACHRAIYQQCPKYVAGVVIWSPPATVVAQCAGCPEVCELNRKELGTNCRFAVHPNTIISKHLGETSITMRPFSFGVSEPLIAALAVKSVVKSKRFLDVRRKFCPAVSGDSVVRLLPLIALLIRRQRPPNKGGLNQWSRSALNGLAECRNWWRLVRCAFYMGWCRTLDFVDCTPHCEKIPALRKHIEIDGDHQ